MQIIYLIAQNTFREIIRDKILYSLLLFGLLMLFGAKLLGAISMQQETKTVLDFGFAMIEIFNVIITLFVGSSLIYKEVEKKLVYFLFSKPISRGAFILGKYAGLALILLLLNFIMFLGFSLMVGFTLTYLYVVCFLFLQSIFLLAISFFFTSFTSPLITLLLTFLTYLIGHITLNLKIFALQYGGSFFQKIANVIYTVMPNLSLLNLKNQVLYEFTWSKFALLQSLLYALLYISLLLLITVLIFRRKEF